MCWSLLILGVCVCRVTFFVLDGKMVDFAEHCSILLAFFAPGNDAHDVASSWKMEVLL
jgi:hypothetical protein